MSRKYPKNYHFTFSRGQLFLMGMVLLLICSISFSLGIMLGYGAFTSSLRQRLPKQNELKTSLQVSKEASFYETLPDSSASSRLATSPQPTYQVQVGAFRQENEARVLQERLQKSGFIATVNKVDFDETGTWFRVRVGNCADKTKAQELAQKLEQEEHLPTLIVR